MQMVKGDYGTAIIGDCIEGMRNLEFPFTVGNLEKQIEDKIILTITDPPYGVKYKSASCKIIISKKTGKEIRMKSKKNTENQYNDSFEDYEGFSRAWFDLVMQISKMLIFTPSNKMNKLQMWFKIQKPEGMAFHYKKNSTSVNSLFRFNKQEPILFYGTFRHQFDFERDVLEIPLSTGFLEKEGYIHPHPKEEKLWQTFIKRLMPESVLDPFLGSGTTIEICEFLKIPWLGFENDEQYIPDLEKRIKIGKKRRIMKNNNLNKWM